MERQQFALVEPKQAHQLITSRVWPLAKAGTGEGHRLLLTLGPEKRSSAENRLLHALIGEIAQSVQWAGAYRDSEVWKRLLVAAWCRARNEHVEVLPALDGYGVDIVYRRTSELDKQECAELIEFVYAWATHNDVRLRARQAVFPALLGSPWRPGVSREV